MDAGIHGVEVSVPREKYLEILGFTIYTYYAGKITAYSGIMGGKRALGEYIENFIYGKVAEVAFQEFLRRKFRLEALTDLDIADFILGVYLPDIIAVKKEEGYEVMKFWIEVKEVRRDQRWLLIPASSTRSRPYDAYVAVWVGLPDEHIAWLVKNVPEVSAKMSSEWKRMLKNIEDVVENIPCKIIGYASWEDVESVEKAKQGNDQAREFLNSKYGPRGWHYFSEGESLFDPDDTSWRGGRIGENIGFALRRLAQATNWEQLRELIMCNQRLVGKVPIRRGMRGIPGFCKKWRYVGDLRELFTKCLEYQLKEIEKRQGTIRRSVSWFQQPLP